jgi:DNA-binding response OmpR family regulator
MSRKKILVVDDEPDAVELIAFNLRGAGYDVITAEDGEEALKKTRQARPDLVVLDLMLPEIDGLEVCRTMRNDPNISKIPIIMLTAKAEEIDRVLGLELGANDYVTKPFSPRELVLRVKNQLKSSETVAAEKGGKWTFGDLQVDVERHTVVVKGKLIDLTATEFKLLTLLIERRGRVQSREQLLRDVWGYETLIDTRTVDTHMGRLREKLGKAADNLDTVRGIGYRFVE